MTSSPDHPQSPAEKPERSFEDVRWSRVERKRDRIRTEVHRNRSGGHKVPTWVLAAVLALILTGWAYLIFAA
jgi:hypothetical protein